jgi:hypothetical protein
MFISPYNIAEGQEDNMRQDIQEQREEYYRSLRHKRLRRPRFAILILIIFAILSIVMAILVAYVIIPLIIKQRTLVIINLDIFMASFNYLIF